MPGDKSVSHRALMLSALATGTSRIRGILQSEDIESTARVLRSLGAYVPALAPEMVVTGKGPSALHPPPSALDCGNSGTTARLMLGILAARPFASILAGDPSLSRRPMRRVAAPLAAMGARLEFPADHDGLPLRVHGGPLRSIEWRLETPSAQVKSAILLAAVCAGVTAVVHEPAPTRDHTERFLRLQGARVECRDGRVALHTAPMLAPLALEVPGDPSAAAFFAALGALADDGEIVLRGVGLNPGRVGFMAALRRMGACVDVRDEHTQGPEPVGDLIVRSGPLRGIAIGAAEVPSLVDEIPMLACVAARAEGETVITGAAELRVKESDRLASVVANLRTIGVEAEELPDGMHVRGSRRPLSGLVRTLGDHRVAMAFGILGASADCDIAIDDTKCVAVSYPQFWQDLSRVVA